jgi:hypothetical protein
MRDDGEMQWFAVRCCCKPDKLLGFYRARAVSNLITVPGPDGPERFSVRVISESGVECGDENANFLVTTFSSRERAIKSDHRELDFWRRIPGFVETLAPRFHFEGAGDLAGATIEFGGSRF